MTVQKPPFQVDLETVAGANMLVALPTFFKHTMTDAPRFRPESRGVSFWRNSMT